MKDEPDNPIYAARLRIALAGGVALLIAGLIFVAVVLPAEYAVDPLGTGARLGLLELGETGRQVDALNAAAAANTGTAAIVSPQPRPFQHETVSFELGPRQFMEYKYRLEKGAVLLFSWKASAAVPYEFHAEPDGAPKGYAQTYDKDRKSEASGTLTAPFAGIHGWYWENPTAEPITVRLTSAGFYTLSHEFRIGAPVKNKTYE